MKKVIGLLTAALLAVTMCTGVFAAAAPPAVKEINTASFQRNLATSGTVLYNSKAAAVSKLTELAAKAGDELRIYLTPDMFLGTDGKTLATAANPKIVVREQLRGAKITLRKSSSKGSAAFESVGLKYDKTKGAYISVQFVKTYPDTKDIAFNTVLYLYEDGKRIDATKITLSGTLANEVVVIDADSDYVDLSEGRVAEAIENVRKIEVYAGSYVTVFTAVTRGKKIYATCTTDIADGEDAIFKAYPGVADVYTLTTLNLRPASKAVKFDLDDVMYVYGADGKYLGTSNNTLAFSEKYYVSEEKYESLKIG